jgi:hypothetical protein
MYSHKLDVHAAFIFRAEKRDVMLRTLVDHYECAFETHTMLYHIIRYNVPKDSSIQSWL